MEWRSPEIMQPLSPGRKIAEMAVGCAGGRTAADGGVCFVAARLTGTPRLDYTEFTGLPFSLSQPVLPRFALVLIKKKEVDRL